MWASVVSSHSLKLCYCWGMNLRSLASALLFLLLPAAAAEGPVVIEVKERAEKSMKVNKASDVKASDQEYGMEVMETLAVLLPADPEAALRYFLKAREQVDADRKAGTSAPVAVEQNEDMKRSASVLAAALGGALQRVEEATPNGDQRLPKIIAAAVEMLASDRGCGVESCRSINTHLGRMMDKAGRADKDGAFATERLMEKLGPRLKLEWLPAVLVPVRGVMWITNTRSNAEAREWLAQQAKEGAHREFAMLLLATARIGSQEHDGTNKARAGILTPGDLPEEQQWLLNVLEQKNRPPAMMASAAAETLRDWPTAEPPLRYAGARALAAAWAADVPVNDDEADRITGSLALLSKDGAPPQDEGFAAAAKLLAEAWVTRTERGRKPLYGWSRTGTSAASGPLLLRLATEAKQSEAAQRIFSIMQTEAAKDESLRAMVTLSESLQRARCHVEALKVLDALTEEKLKGEMVPAELRICIANKRAHIPIQIAAVTGGLDAAVKATVTVLSEKTDDPTAWAGAAWGWYNMGVEFRAAGNHEEALRRFCIGCILGRSTDFFAKKTHGKYLPPSQSACRGELKALKYDPDKVSVFGTQNGVRMMLDEFGEGWKPLSPAAMRRILDGAAVE